MSPKMLPQDAHTSENGNKRQQNLSSKGRQGLFSQQWMWGHRPSSPLLAGLPAASGRTFPLSWKSNSVRAWKYNAYLALFYMPTAGDKQARCPHIILPSPQPLGGPCFGSPHAWGCTYTESAWAANLVLYIVRGHLLKWLAQSDNFFFSGDVWAKLYIFSAQGDILLCVHNSRSQRSAGALMWAWTAPGCMAAVKRVVLLSHLPS